MSQSMNPQSLCRLPPSLSDDLDKLEAMIEDVKANRVSAAQLRAFRVPLGVYEQRKGGTFMLRVRCPAGSVLADQMRTLASVACEYGNGLLHVTTRQDIQVHDVALDAIHPALLRLQTAGLSTKGGGGNTVRNVTACCAAGVCPHEAFDVSPYVIGVTEFLLPDPANYQLPRKYKIAFSGCGRDCAGATVNDLGLIAKEYKGQRGFTVYVAGGMGARSRVGDLLEEFVSEGEVHLIAESVKRVFDKHGNRKNRSKARLRFLVEQIGLDRFRALYRAELAELRKRHVSAPEFRDLPRRKADVETPAELAKGFDVWRERNTAAQKQAGYFVVHIPLILGDIQVDTMAKLADVVATHGEGMVRTTQWQNLMLRWVSRAELPAVHWQLQALGLAETPAPVIRNAVACAGASTCKLGICLSRGLARALIGELQRSGLDLASFEDLKIQISGCPNACGRHPVADVALFGAARRVEGRPVPHYVLQLGGRVAEGETRLAQGKQILPARNVPAFVAAFLKAFHESPEYPDFDAFLQANGKEIARQIADRHKAVPSFDEDKNHYYDWGAEVPFSLAGRGPGECGAGVSELIEVDLSSAREAAEGERLFEATALASRALLVTQGLEAANDAEAIALFEKHFVDRGLVSSSFRSITSMAREWARRGGAGTRFDAPSEQVKSMVQAVQDLYDNMDPSLRFHPPASEDESLSSDECPSDCACAAAPMVKSPQESVRPDREVDLRQVGCPLNYVKTTLALEQMSPGEVLAVLLNDEGARNVPHSAERDGHETLSATKEEQHWRVVIRRGDGQ